jgi:tripartite-type tricarboxylate transporter receptor subunit TctC
MLQVIRTLFLTLAAVLISAVVATGPRAESFPNKPIHVVVPFAAGGAADLMARIVAPQLGAALGQPVVVENRPGASGLIGTGSVVKSSPDGYTLLLGSTTTVTAAPKLYRDPPYDPVKELQPISRLALFANVVILHPSVLVSSVRELITLAKSEPGKLTYGSAGPGSAQHLAGELFKYMTGTDILHVPYKGGAPAMQDLVGGRLSLTFEPLNTALPRIRAGQVKGLAVTTLTRVPALPDLPTVSETVPGYESTIWFGLLGPAGIPRDVVSLLHAAVVKALRTPEVRERLAEQGTQPIGDSVEAFAETVLRESSNWAEVAKKTGLKLEN